MGSPLGTSTYSVKQGKKTVKLVVEVWQYGSTGSMDNKGLKERVKDE